MIAVVLEDYPTKSEISSGWSYSQTHHETSVLMRVLRDRFLQKIVLTDFSLTLLLSVSFVPSIISAFKPIRRVGGEMRDGSALFAEI